MGVVWKAHDTVLDRAVAIKFLSSEDGQSTERIVREARLAARLNHPNVVSVYEVRREGLLACIVMEWIAGQSLADRIRPGGLALEQALALAIPIARALEAAHQAHVIHRDLKPSNVIVKPSGEVKLLDFGIAKSVPMGVDASASASTTTADPLATLAGRVVGTAAYMSPEQIRGQTLDGRSDIFSFGILLHELLSGHRPFRAADDISTIAAILNEEPPPLALAERDALASAASSLVLRCLRKDPARRFQTSSDLRAALEDLAAQRRDEAAGRGRQAARRRWPWAVAAGLVLAGAGAAWLTIPRRAPLQLAPPQQLTYDGGIAATPAISRDGKLLAFASDRAEAGNLDLWVRQLAGGSLARLTTQPDQEWNPQFSPDGTRLLYLSGDQTILEIPVLGGIGQPVAADAGPFSVSPTGEIVYVRLPLPSRSGSIFLLSGSDTPPQPWQPECRTGSRPTWSPEGDRIFFWGECAQSGPAFWSASTQGGTPHRVLQHARQQALGLTLGWFRHRGHEGVVFESDPADVQSNLSVVDFSGGVTSFASFTGTTHWPFVAPTGDLVFGERERDHGIWQLPVQGGEPHRVASAIGHFDVTRDGTKAVFGRLIGGRSGELVVRDLVSGAEQVFASHDSISVSVGSLWPQISHDGRQIVYRVVGASGGHYLLDIATGRVRRLASLEAFQLGSDWSPDNRIILGECAAPGFGLCELDPSEGTIEKLLVHPSDQLLYPSWSADGRWVVFGRRKPGGPSSVWAAPVSRDRRMASASDWVRLSPPGADCQRPRLSLDRTAVYYVAGGAGVRRLLRQAIDRKTLEPIGAPVPAVAQAMELLVVTGGFGPYPLIDVTERGVFYSALTNRGNLFLSRLE